MRRRRFGGRFAPTEAADRWNDAAIPPQASILPGRRRDGRRQNLRSFYRLFMAHGMEHCGGGPGPTPSAACSACLCRAAIPRTTSLRPWPIGSKTARRPTLSSRRAISTTTRPRGSTRSAPGVRIRLPRVPSARATAASGELRLLGASSRRQNSSNSKSMN